MRHITEEQAQRSLDALVELIYGDSEPPAPDQASTDEGATAS
jgi:hypothetical protein